MTHTNVYGKYETTEYFPHLKQVDFLGIGKDATEYDIDYQREKIARLKKTLGVVSRRVNGLYDENSKEVAAFILSQSKEVVSLFSDLKKP